MEKRAKREINKVGQMKLAKAWESVRAMFTNRQRMLVTKSSSNNKSKDIKMNNRISKTMLAKSKKMIYKWKVISMGRCIPNQSNKVHNQEMVKR